jgi:hypothetical protein
MNRLTALLDTRVGGTRPELVYCGRARLLQDKGLDEGGAGELWTV